MSRSIRKRGESSFYVLIIAVTIVVSLFASLSYISSRASASNALSTTARTLTEQIAVLCSSEAQRTGACEYIDINREFNADRFPDGECVSLLSTDDSPRWYCNWHSSNATLSSAPEHVRDTLVTTAGNRAEINAIYLSVDPIQSTVLVRISGCANRGWALFVSWCGTVERTHHL